MSDPIAAFDAVAEAYAREFADELEGKPFDRELLGGFASTLAPAGEVLDVGTGAAGHVGRFFADRGFAVTGVDLSERAIEIARTLNPGMNFVVADFRALPMSSSSIPAVVGFYCFIYGTDDDIVAALTEVRRVLRPGGRLLAAVHGALDDRPVVETFPNFLGKPIDVTVRFTTPASIATLAERAGLRIDEIRVREPYDFEHQSRRIYVLASAP